MKKIVALTMAAMVINFFVPLTPQAHAAFIEDKVAEVIVQDPTVAQVQELMKLKQQLEQGNKEAIWGTLTKAALAKVDQNSVVAVAASGGLGQIAEEVVRQQVGQAVDKRLAPYQEELTILSQLLGGNNLLTPQAARANNSLIGAPQNYKRVLDMTATAYGPGPLDNGKWNNLTYMGGTVRKGVVAVDPTVIPMGTKLWVEGYGEAIAEDQGSAIKGNRIDLAFNTRKEALDYGIQKVKVYVLN